MLRPATSWASSRLRPHPTLTGGAPLARTKSPPHYRDQVQWQLHCTGLDYAVVAVLTARLEFAEYHLHRDDERIAQMCVEADKFMADLESGLEPDWSAEAGDFQVYETLRELHPEIDDYTLEASEALAAAAEREAQRMERDRLEVERMQAENERLRLQVELARLKASEG